MFYQQFTTSYETHTRVIMGLNCIEELTGELGYYKAKNVFVISGPNVSQTGFYKKCIGYVEKAGCNYLTFNEVEKEAPVRNVETVHALLEKNKSDFVIAIGGGSVIDVAKVACVLATNGGKAQDWAGYEKYSTPPVPFFVIPTTAGTSSEVTNMGIIHDEETNVKFSVGHKEHGSAKVAFLDGYSLASCPRAVIAQAGIDAFSHCFESFISLKANPMTDAMALQGIRLISRNLRLVYGNNENALAALDLLAGSTMGGMAFSTTGTGNGHCVGRHLGPKFNIDHGISIALVLPAVARFNFPAQMEKYRQVAQAMDLNIEGLSLAEVGEVVVDAIKKLIRDMGITQTLADFNPTTEDIEELAQDSHKAYLAHYKQRNPAKMSVKDYIGLLEDCR